MTEEKKSIGRYQILGEINPGQVSVVYRARDPELDRTVALKIISTEAFHRPDVLRECLQSEAKLAGSLRHSGIVTIYDIGEDEGDPFIVMEYLKGPTLAELIESGVSNRQAIDIALQLCDALGYAHEQGMVHGDLKPSNIKVLENLKVKIIDFGLARSIQASIESGVFTGTPAYASPEQLRGGQIDERSDIFSLGVILFEMLTGNLPFEADDFRRDQPARERLERVRSGFLKKVLLQALSPDAGQRYQTCSALDYDLKRYQSGDESIFTRNPFIYGPPITEPQHFYGRRREIQIIANRLKGTTPGSSAIIGGRRIGKTSLLRKLSHPDTAQEYGFTGEYFFVYLSPFISNPISDVETQFWQLVLKSMLEQIKTRLLTDSTLVGAIEETLARAPITFNNARDIIAKAHKRKHKIVLLFDEFQLVAGNISFQPGFFGGLRDLAQSYGVAFVTESAKNLQALTITKEVAVSPFWNIFTNVYLGPLGVQEARDLITGYTRNTDISFAEQDFDYVMRISGGHPYFLQLACWCVFDFYQEGKWGQGIDEGEAMQGVEDEFLRQAEPHFAYFWEHSSDAEKRALIILAYRGQDGRAGDQQHEKPVLQPGPGLKVLGERGLIIKTETGAYEIFSPLFGIWIKARGEVNLDELKPHFEHFWAQAEKDERRVLVCLAHRDREKSRLAALMANLKYKRLLSQSGSSLDELMKRGLIVRTDDGDHEIFAPLFSKWILSQSQ